MGLEVTEDEKEGNDVFWFNEQAYLEDDDLPEETDAAAGADEEAGVEKKEDDDANED